MTMDNLNPHQTEADSLSMLKPSLEGWRAIAVDLPLTLTSDMMRFISRRMQAQAEHLAAVGRCRNVPEIIDVQSGFVSRAMLDYKHGTSVIADDVGQATRQAAE